MSDMYVTGMDVQTALGSLGDEGFVLLPLKKYHELFDQLQIMLSAEQQWEKAFATSEDALAKLADEALAEHRAGRTHLLDPDKL